MSQCSASCDSGWQRRLVVCLSNNEHSERCDVSLKPKETQQCNMPQCPSWTTGLWSQVSPLHPSHTSGPKTIKGEQTEFNFKLLSMVLWNFCFVFVRLNIHQKGNLLLLSIRGSQKIKNITFFRTWVCSQFMVSEQCVPFCLILKG